jgi:exportin-1
MGGADEMEAVAQRLLSGDFEISLLDQVVGAAYDPISPHRRQANKALMQLQESPELWQKADAIIEQSQNPNSRFFGLQVLDDAIKTRCVPLSLFGFLSFHRPRF